MLQSNIQCGMLGVQNVVSRLGGRKADTSQQAKFMVLQARFYEYVNMPQKALSIAVRAASLAYTNRIVPILCEGIEVIAHALLTMSEFAASSRLLESILPRVIECEDCNLTGAYMASIADAYMGIASHSTGEAAWQVQEKMFGALGCLERAESEFSRVGNVRRQREVLAKRGVILMSLGHHALATDFRPKYLDVGKDLGGSIPP